MQGLDRLEHALPKILGFWDSGSIWEKLDSVLFYFTKKKSWKPKEYLFYFITKNKSWKPKEYLFYFIAKNKSWKPKDNHQKGVFCATHKDGTHGTPSYICTYCYGSTSGLKLHLMLPYWSVSLGHKPWDSFMWSNLIGQLEVLFYICSSPLIWM